MPPRPARAPAPAGRTASGSTAVRTERARVARASRILVEGVHDAELVEKVWGDDLRVEGVVVERLDGMDDLAAVVDAFRPGPGRRLGVLLDHLVDGTKEARVAAAVRHPHVLVTGTPYVDVWQAVRPRAAGIDAWPVVPMGEPWKEGVIARPRRPGHARRVLADCCSAKVTTLRRPRPHARRRGRAAHRLRHDARRLSPGRKRPSPRRPVVRTVGS